MYHQGCREDLVVIFLLLYKVLYKSLECPEVSFERIKSALQREVSVRNICFFENLNHLLIDVEYIRMSTFLSVT